MIKLEMTKKQEIILAVIIVIAALVFVVMYAGVGQAPEPEPIPMISVIMEQVEHQSRVDERMLNQLENSTHDFNDPLVIVDPYGMSPLTALVLFKTYEPMSVSMQIAGRTDDASVGYTFYDFNTMHIIPVLGLYPDMLNLVELTIISRDGFVDNVILMIETDPLPEELPDGISSAGLERVDFLDEFDLFDLFDETEQDSYSWSVVQNEPVPEKEFYFTFVRKSAFDSNGDYRWFYSNFDLVYPTWYMYNGNMVITVGSLAAGDALTLEVNKLGRIMRADTAFVQESMGFDALRVERRPLYTHASYDMGIGTPVHVPAG
jgi:hypothetical protein